MPKGSAARYCPDATPNRRNPGSSTTRAPNPKPQPQNPKPSARKNFLVANATEATHKPERQTHAATGPRNLNPKHTLNPKNSQSWRTQYPLVIGASIL